MNAAGLDSSDAAAKVREWQARQRAFIDQTCFKHDYAREQIATLVRGKNVISGIETPLISTAENRERRYLENLRSGNVHLNRRHKDIIKEIPSKGDWSYFAPNKVELKDLAALTAATKDEFALFSNGERAIIIHGATNWNIPESAWTEIERQKLVWVGHSHPPTVNVAASDQDRETLRKFFTWQEKSAIIDILGNVCEYTGSYADRINELFGMK